MPCPVVIVQDDSFDGTDSITVCAFTSDATDAPLFRLPTASSMRAAAAFGTCFRSGHAADGTGVL